MQTSRVKHRLALCAQLTFTTDKGIYHANAIPPTAHGLVVDSLATSCNTHASAGRPCIATAE